MSQFMPNVRVLRTVPLFSLFSEEQLSSLVPALQHRSYPRNACILNAGDMTDTLYIILSGRARILIDDGHGREVILNVLGPNEFFGEMSLLDGGTRSATVVSETPVRLLVIKRENFSVLCREVPDLTQILSATLSRRLRQAEQRPETSGCRL